MGDNLFLFFITNRFYTLVFLILYYISNKKKKNRPGNHFSIIRHKNSIGNSAMRTKNLLQKIDIKNNSL